MINNICDIEITPLDNIDEIRCWENRPFTTIWPEPQLQKPKGVFKTIRKRPGKVRSRFTKEQIRTLEKQYVRNKYPDTESRRELAKSLILEENRVRVWFQNRRSKNKRVFESSSDSASNIMNLTYSQQTAEQRNLPEVHYNSEYILPDPCRLNYTNQDYCQNYNNFSPQNQPYDNNATFYYDYNIHPTQYYPNFYVGGIETANQYDMQGNEIQNYSAENYGSSYISI